VFVTSHVLAGAAIGAVVRRPALAVPLALASHFALDAVPHWGHVGHRTFLVVAVCDGLLGLTVLATVTRRAPERMRAAVVAGAIGAALPDLDKPAGLVGLNPYPAAFQAFHGAIQQESAGRWWVEVLAGAALAGVAFALLRRDAPNLSPQGVTCAGKAGSAAT